MDGEVPVGPDLGCDERMADNGNNKRGTTLGQFGFSGKLSTQFVVTTPRVW